MIVVGGGQAGLCLSHSLQERAIGHLVLERDVAFSAWRNRWDGFRANTPNWMNRLPFADPALLPSEDPDGFATAPELVAYLETCRAAVNPPLVTGVEVRRIAPAGAGWSVTTGRNAYFARSVAVCSGAMAAAKLPPGAETVPASVPQIHSSQYRGPAQIGTGSVLVVGTGSSGVQIGRLLCETGGFDRVHFARSKVLVLPRHILGAPTHRVIHAFGLFDVRASSTMGRFMHSSLETKGDPIMRPTPADLRRSHGAEVHGRFAGFADGRVRFADGGSLAADDLTILWCSGFRPDYALVDLPDRSAAFHPSGHPKHVRGIVDAAPGLYFVGLRYQHTVASHDIYGVARDAEHVAGAIRAGLGRTARAA